MVDWLAYRCNVSRSTAGKWVRATSALEALPRIRERFVAGHLSFEQVNLAISFAGPEDDEHLADLLPALRPLCGRPWPRGRRRVRA